MAGILEGSTRWRLLPGGGNPFPVLGLLAALACGDGTTAPNDPDPPGTTPPPTTYDHSRGPGASANDLLAGGVFDRLVVEVQYTAGQAPTAAGLEHLRAFAEARLHKPGGVTIEVAASPLSIAAQDTYTSAEVRQIEASNRTTYTEGSTLALYALFLNGEYEGAPNVLGIAYNNTSLAIFEETIRAHSGGALQPSVSAVEGTVLQHELGHLMGLVNTGSDMQTDHQDESHGHHCDRDDCLMYWAVRTTDFIANLLDGMPDLDEDCLDDLRANGGA